MSLRSSPLPDRPVFFGVTPRADFGITPRAYFGVTPCADFGVTPCADFGVTPCAEPGRSRGLAPESGDAELPVRVIEKQAFGQPVRICGFEDRVAMIGVTGHPEGLLDLQCVEKARGNG